jgi:hypothetical protein
MSWVGGLSEWTEGETAYISVAFTWLLPDAYSRAAWYRQEGYRVLAGGPALFDPRMKKFMAPVAEVPKTGVGVHPDAITRQNPLATFASRGCPVGCFFCNVPKMEGTEFTLIPDFPVRPILCDNNLSALPPEYQDHIIARYKAEGVPLMDANSGFEPQTFTDDVYARWRKLVHDGGGPWRFAFDEQKERDDVARVMNMLRDEAAKKKRVYVIIGTEPFEDCMDRIRSVIGWGGEPHVQPFIKLNQLNRNRYGRPIPAIRHDWSEQLLTDVARWVNGWVYKNHPFEEYRRSRKKEIAPEYDIQQGLFS